MTTDEFASVSEGIYTITTDDGQIRVRLVVLQRNEHTCRPIGGRFLDLVDHATDLVVGQDCEARAGRLSFDDDGLKEPRDGGWKFSFQRDVSVACDHWRGSIERECQRGGASVSGRISFARDHGMLTIGEPGRIKSPITIGVSSDSRSTRGMMSSIEDETHVQTNSQPADCDQDRRAFVRLARGGRS